MFEGRLAASAGVLALTHFARAPARVAFMPLCNKTKLACAMQNALQSNVFAYCSLRIKAQLTQVASL